jgi:hypothetical protein
LLTAVLNAAFCDRRLKHCARWGWGWRRAKLSEHICELVVVVRVVTGGANKVHRALVAFNSARSEDRGDSVSVAVSTVFDAVGEHLRL